MLKKCRILDEKGQTETRINSANWILHKNENKNAGGAIFRELLMYI